MTRFACLLPLLLAACSTAPAPLPPPDADVRPVVASDRLAGRWTISAVNGTSVSGPWLELGGEGAGAVTPRADGGVDMESPQPPTRAYLGCNNLLLSGWTRNGDKLVVGSSWSTITEIGCAPPVMAIEEQARAILRLPMTMELTPPARLRLINEAGTLDLVRAGETR
jgi:hypothetical protein